MRASLICLISNFLFVSVAMAQITFCGTFKQGEIIYGKTTSNTKTLKLQDKNFSVANDGTFLLALSRDEIPNINIALNGENFSFNVAPTIWDIQYIKGVSQNKVTPSQKDEAEILREQKDVRKALSTINMTRQNWKEGFILPVEGVISGHFGNQRFFNGVPKNPHTGTDIAAPEGTPVLASSSGIVLLSGGNYFYGGNMVIIDHGMGLQTIYMHLNKTNVKVGHKVKKGDVIGFVGKTGRATGAHLHWGASLNNIRFRPHALLEWNNFTCRHYPANQGED